MFTRSLFRSLAMLLLIVVGLSALPASTGIVAAADPGNGSIGTLPEGATLASTVNGIHIAFAQEYGKTTIFLRICADSSHFQMRSENIGQWFTEIFNRTEKANGCSPSNTIWWRMVYNIDVGSGERFGIYATANDTYLSESEFMARAARTVCYVTGYGTGYCNPANPAPVSVSRGNIDSPAAGQQVSGTIEVRGWAVDAGSLNGTGVSDVHVYVNDTFIGAANYGRARGDVAGVLGDGRFTNSGYDLNVDTTQFSNGNATLKVGFRRARDGVWTTMERVIAINNGTPPPPDAQHTNTIITGAVENGKTTFWLQVCGKGNHYRFRSYWVNTKQVLWDKVYGAIDGCSPKYRAVMNADVGDTFQFTSTVMNDIISDSEFEQRRKDTCKVWALGDVRCSQSNTAPQPPVIVIPKPTPPTVSDCEVPFFSQIDPSWSSHPLRTGRYGTCYQSSRTIGAAGCTLTSSAMVFRYYGADINPPRLSDAMGSAACPFGWWDGVATTGGKVARVDKYSFSWQSLEREVNQNRRPAVLGMHTTQGYTHWVVVLSGSGSNPGNYVINDPGGLYGAKVRLSSLTSRGWIPDTIVIYEGQRPANCTSVANSDNGGTIEQAHDWTGLGEVSIEDVSHSVSNGISPVTWNSSLQQSATITGTATILMLDDTSATLELSAESDAGEISEMLISSDTFTNDVWQPFSPHIQIPAKHEIYFQFKDSAGNVSSTSTVFTVPLVDEALASIDYSVYLPLILR